MSRRGWFIHFLKRSLGRRKGRLAVASLSVTIAAAVVVSSLGISLGIRQKLGGELRSYGANVMVVPREGRLGEDVLGVISSDPEVDGYSGQIYFALDAGGVQVEAIGLDFGWLEQTGWKIDGRPPSRGEVVAGSDLRRALGLEADKPVGLSFGPARVSPKVSGFVERGGPEDRAFLFPLEEAQALSGNGGELSAVLVRARAEDIEGFVRRLAGRLPQAEVKTLRQVAFAEESFLKKMELLMALVTLVVLVASSISVSSTMSATVLERTKEIGLMRAIGGTKMQIRGFYMAEGAVTGLVGGALGFLLGFASAQAVSRGAFGSFIGVPPYLLPAALAMGVLLAVSSSMVPLLGALKSRPSEVLRGE